MSNIATKQQASRSDISPRDLDVMMATAAAHARKLARSLKLSQTEREDTEQDTVRFEDNGFIVVADLPKRVKWDQQRLKELVDLIRSGWGEDPSDYVKLKFEVSERAYESWPARLKELFTPARTVESGKPAYELIPPKTF